MSDEGAKRADLPLRPFFYTIDQVATLLSMEISYLNRAYVYFSGRTTGPHSNRKMLAVDIAPPGESPDWRIAEEELIRFLRMKGWRIYEKTLKFY